MNILNRIFIYFTALVGLTGLVPVSAYAELSMAVQPELSEEDTRQLYQPLAEFLSKVTGQDVVVHTSRDYSEYWVTQKANNPYQIIIDNAFFTDFRNDRHGWISLVKLPGLISYSLVATADNPVFEPAELVGKRVASLIPPAPSGIFLGQMFRNPLRQPAIVPTTSSKDSLQLLMEGNVDAAIIPTPMANVAMAGGSDLLVVKTSVQIPDAALSVSPGIDEAMREKIMRALLEADQSDAGKAVLGNLNIANFEPADPSLYSGLMQYLIDFSFAN